METLQGRLLVASPYLADPNFYRTVVLMVQHDSEGALGLVLNRPSDSSVAEIWQRLEEACDCDDPVYVGGPCPGPLMALHTSAQCAEEEILDDVYFATRRDSLIKVVARAEKFRIFSGYAGWGASQLEAELEEGSWLTTDADPDALFADSADQWRAASQRINAEVIFSSLGIKSAPPRPDLN